MSEKSLFFVHNIYMTTNLKDGTKVISDQLGIFPSQQDLETLLEHVKSTLVLPQQLRDSFNKSACPELTHDDPSVRRAFRNNGIPEKSGFVYLMKNYRNGYVKIGYSVNPEYRESTLQSEEPEIELIYKYPADQQEEKMWHSRYQDKRIRGEWFALTPEDIENFKIVSRPTTESQPH